LTAKKKLVWLDCDPGHDDAMAIILACYHPSLELLGISTTCGNQTLEKTTRNACKILHIINKNEIDVVAGSEKPLLRPSKICPEIHGETGLDGPLFPSISKQSLRGKKAINHMFEVISAQSDKVHLIATGQLTNVALLLTVYPEIKTKLEQITMMAGCIGVGNTSPAAEFNIECDPEAARIVFNSGLKLVMVPLEVSHTALVDDNVLARINQMQSNFSKFIIELLLFFKKTYQDVFRFTYPPLHDPCAVAFVINEALFDSELMRVDIDCESIYCAGRTVCDIYQMKPAELRNCIVAKSMNVAEFWNMMIDALEAANIQSCLNR
jgi:inosine-uridine nucleoside N-ribohydrolase